MIRAGVVGWPIGHSLSPLIHGAWIEAVGLDATYEAFPAPDEAAFDALIDLGRTGALRGLNVTAPWKERALAAADEATDRAAVAGSANLLIFDRGRVRADTTDGEGLLAALAELAPALELPGASVLILGAGGAARAAASALKAAEAHVAVANRTPERAEALARALGVQVASRSDAAAADLVVNALPVEPALDLAALKSGAVVMDMTYRPLVTPLLAAARARGLGTVDGLAMLIEQARPSFRALFGVAEPDVDVRALCLARLEAAA